MEQLLKDIQARLVSEVPELAYVDEDWGQLDYYNPNPPAKWPCGLVDLNRAGPWSDFAKNIQTAPVQVKIKVADQRLTPSSATATQGQKDAGFAIVAILKKVHQALHGWTGHQHYSRLTRLSIDRIKRDDGVRLYEVIYVTQITDDAAMPAQTTASGVTPEISTSTLP